MPHPYMLLRLSFTEFVLANATERAYPVFGQILESCSRLDAVLRIAYFRIILITTNVAYVLFHFLKGIKLNNRCLITLQR